MRARGLPRLGPAAAVALALAGAGAPPAGAAASSFAVTTGCQEHQAFVDGDEGPVAARLSERYTPVRDPLSGRPLLFVRALRCGDVTLRGRAAPATMASFGIVVESPDGTGCASGAPVLGSVKGDMPPACNWYTLFWLADDRRVVDWLRAGTPGFPAAYVPNLVFDLGAFDPARGGAPFHFQAPEAPSPFTIDDIGRERPGELPVRGGYWVDTPQGTVKVAISTYDLTSGDATGTVHAAPGSEMAALFGADERSYVPGYSVIAAERWGHLVYRKQILAAAGDADSFDGSCSLHGTARFDPPATNTQRSLALTYDGTGACTGTLDGRKVSNAPVRVHHTGGSDGSCVMARTTAPVQGAITFADGTTIAYTLDFSFVLTEGDVTWYGERSGSARGHGTFVTPQTPPDAAAKCAGEGDAALPLDFTLTTDSPLVSERAAGQDRPGTLGSDGGRGGRERLRLAVSPRTVRAGHRTTFAFHVATPTRRSVAGALVRFAGRNARAGKTGTATIAATLHRAGRRAARATKPGFRGARATIRVDRR